MRHGGTTWTRTATAGGPFRIVPDGCMDVIWIDGTLLVAGPDTGPHLGVSAPGATYVGYRFPPGAGPAALGVPADAVGLSARQLQRRCLAAFGYGPKTLARVLRLDRALGLARAGIPYATVAATAGYADQAHLAREVRALTGVPLGRL